MRNLIMNTNTSNTDIFGIGQEKGKIVVNDFSESQCQSIKTFRIKAVKNEPCETDISTGSYCNSSSSETDSVHHKHATDSSQEQNEEEFDAKNPNLEDLDHSKFSDNLSTKCDAVQIKNEGDIDIFHEDIKRETGEEKPGHGFNFCQMCYQNFDIETDIFKSTSHRLECTCQKQYKSLFYNILGEDMSHDVKSTSIGLTTVSGLKSSGVQDESTYEAEVIKEQDSSAVPLRLSVPSVEIDNRIQWKFCSNSLENNHVKHQMKDKTEKIIHCKTCSKSFSQMRYLKVHERRHTGENPFNCKICSKNFSSSSELKVHGRIHTGEKPFYCKICSKSFNQMGNLKTHERSHTGEKPFQCKICSKACTTSSELKVHERIHTGEKPFHCRVCSKSFSQTSHLKIHERSHTGGKQFQCKICSKNFTSFSNLNVHGRIHTREKPFHCQLCSKSFSRTVDLKVHERSHTGEKPFHCIICFKNFTTSRYLKVHQRIHTGENLFHCEICSKAFNRMDNLERHESIHTVEKPLNRFE